MKNKQLELDLLLVNPGGRTQIYQSLGSTLSAIEPPIWAGLIATFIRNRGFSVHILDANAEDLSPEETAEQIAEMAPLLTAIVVYGHNPSASTQVMPGAGAVCTAVKEMVPKLKTVLVGGHVAALPKRTLHEEKADFVAGGEGVYTILDLLQGLKGGRLRPSSVRGLWYRDDGSIVATPPAPLVLDLDREMPEVAWDLLPMDKYRAHNWHCFGGLERQPYAALYTTVGCPYHCSFCCIQAPFRAGEQVAGYRANVNSYRFWSPDVVVDQIDKLVTRYGVRNVRISDEMFVLNKRHVHAICDRLIERGHDLNMWSYARMDTVRDQETIEKLKRAGMNWLCFGIESASERVRTDVQKGFKQDLVYKVIDQVCNAGIHVIGNYILGLPEDDTQSMQQTVDLALELNCEFANFYSAMAYPGSELYDIAEKQGWKLPEKWSGYSQHSVDTLPLPTNYISASEVLRFRDRAWQVYFNHPPYLEMIQRKFGSATVAQIREMASHKLVRLHA